MYSQICRKYEQKQRLWRLLWITLQDHVHERGLLLLLFIFFTVAYLRTFLYMFLRATEAEAHQHSPRQSCSFLMVLIDEMNL